MRQAIRSVAQKLPFQVKQVQYFHHTSRASLTSSPSYASATNDAGSAQPHPDSQQPQDSLKATEEKHEIPKPPRKKTMAELDEELRLKLDGLSGDGGSAGVEYENGKAEGLKRGVKSNMFRVI